MNWKQVPIPDRMRGLEKDRRGYLIPYAILRDDNGYPHFQKHDINKVEECINKKLCIICGQPLGTDIWLAGGPLSAFHLLGAYIEPPMHGECGRYAMQVCPYLAVSPYKKRLDDKTPTGGNVSETSHVNTTVIKGKPPFFVMAKTLGYQVVSPDSLSRYLLPIRPFLDMEFWKDGKPITLEQVEELLKQYNNDEPSKNV